jgi:ABC-type branched-subunit amino acid transport system ATPase component
LGPKTEFYCENFYAPPKFKIALGPQWLAKHIVNLISGLLKPDIGKIVVNGVELTNYLRGN